MAVFLGVCGGYMAHMQNTVICHQGSLIRDAGSQTSLTIAGTVVSQLQHQRPPCVDLWDASGFDKTAV